MDVQELTKQVEPEKKSRNRGWLVAAAAFAVVIVAIGAALVLARPSAELPPAATTPTTTQAVTPTTVAVPEGAAEQEAVPTTVAAAGDAVSPQDQAIVDGYVTAFNDADQESVLALMSPSAKVISAVNNMNESSPEVWSDALAWRWALNEQWAVDSCNTSFGAIVCQLTITGGWADSLGAQDAVLRFIITDGVVSSLSLNEDSAVLFPLGVEFGDWMAAEHPAEMDIMLTRVGRPKAPLLTEESIALWVELIPEWEATLEG